MSTALKALESASRRELQSLAKELQLCKGNAKSDVIVSHAMQFLDSHPKDGEQQVLGALGGDSPTPKKEKASPKPKKEKACPKSTKKETVVVNEKKSKKQQQPEDEPSITVKSMKVVETKKTPTKKSEETKKVTPKDKKKAKQASFSTKDAVKSPKESVKVASSKVPKETVKASPVTKKSPTSKTKPSENAENKQVASIKKKAPVVKKPTPLKGRKALEALVKSTPDLSFVGETRVRCSTTGHEMKADVEMISKYITGKRYQKAHNLNLSFAKYAPMFVDHPDESKTEILWCNVTESAIARDVKRVQEHIAAHKYQNQLSIWKEQTAAKEKAEEEEAQRRAARIKVAREKRLAAANGDKEDAAEKKRPTKRAKKTVDSGRKK